MTTHATDSSLKLALGLMSGTSADGADVVLLSTDGEDSPYCQRHPKRRIVAACTRCSGLLCKHCLDRIDDEFVCSECVQKVVASEAAGGGGGLLSWFKRLFGG